MTETLETLVSFVKLRNELQQDINTLNKQIDSEQSEAEKAKLKQELDKLESDLRATKRNLENIAAGVDISRLRAEKEEEFNFQKEIFALLKPALDEMREMTSHVRQKSDLREKIIFYEERLPVIEQALSNINRLQEQSKDKSLKKSLNTTAGIWRKQQAFMQSELQAARLELDKLEATETSITEASHSYLKSFFQKRGLYLTEALLLVLAILLLSRLSYAAMQRYIPGFRKKHRSFRVRLVELAHRILTVIMVIFGPMIVFYLVEDWVLFSLGILLLLGIALTLRHTLPLYWHQVQLFLNIGSVREGERVMMEGLPWLVERINIYCTFSNPMADISQRLPIADLVDLKSRPAKPDEPWFPCKKGDWVILSDGVRGKVIGISHELVQLVERGGAQLTYLTGDFLAKSPRNLATNFRIKENLGISYSLQKEITTRIPEILH
ncbi:MAG: coiled-coil domain-containing protein, partial [Thiogranum sp.]